MRNNMKQKLNIMKRPKSTNKLHRHHKHSEQGHPQLGEGPLGRQREPPGQALEFQPPLMDLSFRVQMGRGNRDIIIEGLPQLTRLSYEPLGRGMRVSPCPRTSPRPPASLPAPVAASMSVASLGPQQ